MKKELKDYLHLYLGAKCLIVKVFGAKVVEEVLTATILDEAQYYDSHEKYIEKLILRPLSDITKGELIEVYKMVNSKNWQHHIGREFSHHAHLYIFNGLDQRKEVRPTFEPELTRHLLSKGFDIFGLIEAGLAIDATTLENQ